MQSAPRHAVVALPHWEHFEHSADVGVRGIGRTLAEAFEQVALALTAVIADPKRVAARETVIVRCSAPDAGLLLVGWLNELVYEMAVKNMLFSACDVAIDGSTLTATCRGELLNRARHRPAVEVKGATHTALRVEAVEGGWVAQCVVDV